ncbi:hypothetical protein A1Q2_01521 [Trichosporon asahii var. asahii CBS 8904]|uniref:Glutathione S-transferase C-terminal domain-containing protein n=1 Tax=Trichosporon asahii var. asahii (strain CBS 8904) TaxID=1220162 RepID=K1VJC7_TRIAC|nr:hypothetical protein A1Q2_01521 [Trichosporon asahii var. asahii CBS 8904]
MSYRIQGDLKLLRVVACLKFGELESRVKFIEEKQTGFPWNSGTPECYDETGSNLGQLDILAVEQSPLLQTSTRYPEINAKSENAFGLENYDFDPIATGLLEELEAKAAGNAERFTKLQGDMKSLLSIYEVLLSNTGYLVGGNLSAPDLFHIPVIYALKKDFKNVETWWNTLAGLGDTLKITQWN